MRAVKIQRDGIQDFRQDCILATYGPETECLYIAAEKSTCCAYGTRVWIECNIQLDPGDQLYVTDGCKLEVRRHE